MDGHREDFGTRLFSPWMIGCEFQNKKALITFIYMDGRQEDFGSSLYV
jgi:hypothetical protein